MKAARGDAAPAQVDVLIAVYNAENTIRSAVESIRAQTLTDIRIIVINDGSTDGTGDILATLAADDPRLMVFSRANSGVVDAPNFGLTHCTAEFVARLDADDLAYPERLAIQRDFLLANPDVVAVSAAARHIDASGRPTGTIARLRSPDEADFDAIPSSEPYLIHPLVMVRRAAYAAVRGYRHVHYAEDTDLYWRLREHGRLHILDKVLGDYRLHDESISGGSIVNGRIMAIGSQLAALSARRRAQGKPDLVLVRETLADLKRARNLSAMLVIAERIIHAEERDIFQEAVTAKLMELASYRPYEIEADDCAVIRRVADRGFDHLPADKRSAQIKRITGTAARLAAQGHLGMATAMVPRRHLPSFAARYVVRAPVFSALRRAVKQGRDLPLK